MKPALIALTGLAQSGKTTLANALVKNHGYVRVSFADPIRAMCRELGLTAEQMSAGKNDPVDWLGGKTPRQIMQTLGTEWGRNMVVDDIWIHATKRRVLNLWSTGTEGVVIDDCRFDNEAALMLDMGGKVYQVCRDGLQAMNHASEAGVSSHLLTGKVHNHTTDFELIDFHAECLVMM